MLRSCRAPQPHSNPCDFCPIAYLTYYPCGWNCSLYDCCQYCPNFRKKAVCTWFAQMGLMKTLDVVKIDLHLHPKIHLFSCCCSPMNKLLCIYTSIFRGSPGTNLLLQTDVKGVRVLRQTWRPYVWLLCCNLFYEAHSGCISMFLRILSSLSHSPTARLHFCMSDTHSHNGHCLYSMKCCATRVNVARWVTSATAYHTQVWGCMCPLK